MNIAAEQVDLVLPSQTSACDILELQAEVSEGCLWLEKNNPAHCRLIQRELRRADHHDDEWWRARIRYPLGWWLAYFEVPGYEDFLCRGVD